MTVFFMDITLWIVQGLLAAAFLAAGSMKLTQPRQKHLESGRPGMRWVEDVSDPTFRLIGGAELLGALGVVLPLALGILSWLTPVAGIGLALTMLGALLVHVRRGDPGSTLAAPLVLGLLAIVVTVGRFSEI